MLDEENWTLAKEFLPGIFDQNEELLQSTVQKVASEFFVSDLIDIYEPVLLHRRREELRVVANWFTEGAMFPDEIGPMALDLYANQIRNQKLIVLLQEGFGPKSRWMMSDTTVENLRQYFKGILHTDDMYIVTESYNICVIITHDHELKIAAPLKPRVIYLEPDEFEGIESETDKRP
jgi:hypothetical protein